MPFHSRVARWVAPLLLASTVIVVPAGAAVAESAPVIYVNRTVAGCSDTGTGTPDVPFCTISAGVATAEPGQSVMITGAYTEDVVIGRSGESGRPIAIEGATGASLQTVTAPLTVDGRHDITIRGIQLTGPTGAGALAVRRSAGIVLSGLTITTQSDAPAVDVSDSQRITLQSGQVRSSFAQPEVGIRFAAVTDSVVEWIGLLSAHFRRAIDLDEQTTGVRLNHVRIYNAQDAAIVVAGPANIVQNSVITNPDTATTGGGVRLAATATGTVIAANSILTTDSAVVVAGADDAAIVNNEVRSVRCSGVRLADGSTRASVQNNLVDASGGTGECGTSATDHFGIAIYGDAVDSAIVDYNTVAQQDQGDATRMYAWGTPTAIPSVTAFQQLSGQGAHDIGMRGAALASAGIRDSANSAAPGWPGKDVNGFAPQDMPDVANTGVGPVAYADRGPTELVKGPQVRLSISKSGNGRTVTATASTVAGYAPVTSYLFTFTDGTELQQSTPQVTHTFPADASSFSVTVRVTDANGMSAYATENLWPGNGYESVAPTRVLDTRQPGGPTGGKPVWGRGSFTLDLRSRLGGRSVKAVVLTVTATKPTSAGFLTAYAAGSPRPNASNLNWVTGQTVSNLVTVPVADGKTTLFNAGVGSVHVVADLAGLYPDVGGLPFVPQTGKRILDTRAKIGVSTTTAVRPHTSVVVTIPGGQTSAGQAALLNLTVTQPSTAGFLTAYPADQAMPTTSNVNWTRGQTVATLAAVRMSDDRKIRLYNSSSGTVHIVADFAGYFGAEGSARLITAGPVRALDTRAKIGVATTTPINAYGTATFQVAGRYGIPATGVTAVVVNLTATQPTRAGYLTAYPDGRSRPGTSSLNFVAGQTVPNMAVVPVVNGKITVYNGGSGTVHAVADILGYYIS